MEMDEMTTLKALSCQQCGAALKKKSRDILKAITAGRSYDQILASDSTLTYHDIFHVVTGAPTSFWRKAAAKRTGEGLPADATPVRKPLKNRRD
jgi:hypothetical protein